MGLMNVIVNSYVGTYILLDLFIYPEICGI